MKFCSIIAYAHEVKLKKNAYVMPCLNAETAWNWVWNCIEKSTTIAKFRLHKRHRIIDSWNMLKIKKYLLKTEWICSSIMITGLCESWLNPFYEISKSQKYRAPLALIFYECCTLLDYARVWIMYACRSNCEVFSINMIEALGFTHFLAFSFKPTHISLS